jgi:hypothetical protein
MREEELPTTSTQLSSVKLPSRHSEWNRPYRVFTNVHVRLLGTSFEARNCFSEPCHKEHYRDWNTYNVSPVYNPILRMFRVRNADDDKPPHKWAWFILSCDNYAPLLQPIRLDTTILNVEIKLHYLCDGILCTVCQQHYAYKNPGCHKHLAKPTQINAPFPLHTFNVHCAEYHGCIFFLGQLNNAPNLLLKVPGSVFPMISIAR